MTPDTSILTCGGASSHVPFPRFNITTRGAINRTRSGFQIVAGPEVRFIELSRVQFKENLHLSSSSQPARKLAFELETREMLDTEAESYLIVPFVESSCSR